MEKLRETVIKLASENLKEPLSSSQIALIDKHLHESFPHGLRLPSHPTYASMVIKAIRQLREQGGSSEDSISEQIKANCDDLPWAHKSILSHHLKKLCDEGFILLLSTDRYSLPGFHPKKGKSKRKRFGTKQKLRQGKRSLDLQEGKELIGLDSPHGIADDEHMKNGCKSLVVVEDKEEKKGLEALEIDIYEKGGLLEKQRSSITMPSISDLVKIRRMKRKRECDGLLTGRTEDDNGGDLMNDGSSLNTPVMKKKDAERVNTRSSKRQRKCVQFLAGETEEKALLDKSRDKTRNKGLSLEDDRNGLALQKKDTEKQTDRLLVCGLAANAANAADAAKTPEPTKPEQERRVITRQLSKSKEQPKKLNTSPVNPLPTSKVQKRDNRQEPKKLIESLVNPIPKFQDENHDNPEEPKKLITSPVNPIPSSQHENHDNPQEGSIPSSQDNHADPQEASTPSSQETKGNWPSWVQSLLETDFLGNCKVHAKAEKSRCNLYCLDCKNGALCTSCLTSHEGHNVIGINNTEFEAGINVSDIEKHVNVSGIHTHKGYGPETTIILKRTIPLAFPMAANNFCVGCQRRLPYEFEFCTLICKFQHEQKLVGSVANKIK